MEKIFQIIIVFILLALIILYFIRGRERRFKDYFFVRRIRHPLPAVPHALLIVVDTEPGVDAQLFDPASHLLYVYAEIGNMTIYKVLSDGEHKEMQVLAVPVGSERISLDTAKDELYFSVGEEVFVFSK